MPLPTSSTGSPPTPFGAYSTTTSRGGDAEPPPTAPRPPRPVRTIQAPSRTVTRSPARLPPASLTSATARPASPAGFLLLDGGPASRRRRRGPRAATWAVVTVWASTSPTRTASATGAVGPPPTPVNGGR